MSSEVTLSEEKQLARRAVDMLVKPVALLRKVLDESYKPRKELVDISKRMSFQTKTQQLHDVAGREDAGFEKLLEILHELWPEELYKCTKMRKTDTAASNREGYIVIIVDPSDVKQNKIMEALVIKF
ncbi:hypothetical protein JTB14_001442 [Gonioctena quinquepunctata]|nr:hypothetical protein JTB14_001442 [Gonioctena quinquepunctata]